MSGFQAEFRGRAINTDVYDRVENTRRIWGFRRDNLALDSTLVKINSIEKKIDKIICAPYLSFPRTFQYLMRRDWQQLNFDNQSGRVVLKAPLRFACKRDLQEAGLVDTYTKAFRSSDLDNLMRELLISRSVNFNSLLRCVDC